jgi:hypothetical protein
MSATGAKFTNEPNFALGYVRREANQIGNELIPHAGRTAAGESPMKIVELPFGK